MLLQVYCVYDSAIKTWRLPMFARAKGEILRWWIETVNNPQSDLAKYPSDYVLFEIGTFDDADCSFDLLKAPVSLGVALEYVKSVSDMGSEVVRALPPGTK